MRTRLKANGYDPETCLRAKVSKGMGWVPWFAMFAQLICLIMLAFGDIIDPEGNAGGGIVIFSIATSAVVVPMIVYRILKSKGKVREIDALSKGEKTFDETFPPLNK